MNPEGEKGKAAVGRICRKGRIKHRVREWVGDGIPIIISVTISMTVGR